MRRATAILTALLLAGSGAAAAADADAKRKRPRLHLKRAAKGRAHVPAWLLRSFVPTLAPVTPAGSGAGEPAPPPADPGTGEPAPAPQPGSPPPPPPKYHRSGVALDEYSAVPTRNPLDAGSIELVATNYGEDEHDLALANGADELLGRTDPIPPQGSASLELQLGPGSYRIYCSLLDHAQQGMENVLVVR